MKSDDDQTAWLELAHWRRSTAELYAEVRRLGQSDPEGARKIWIEGREEMFRTHAQSPIAYSQRGELRGLDYYPYDPKWRLVVEARPRPPEGARVQTALPEGTLHYRAIGEVEVPARAASEGAGSARLTLYWLEGYGGGLFLPFGDATNGAGSYGGGRYLYDTIKGADLGAGPEEIVLDFNFAYNPSCAYSPQWVCPLAPRENILPFPIEAGERHVGY